MFKLNNSPFGFRLSGNLNLYQRGRYQSEGCTLGINMTKIKRYILVGAGGYNEGLIEEEKHEFGEWVKYKDLRELLKAERESCALIAENYNKWNKGFYGMRADISKSIRDKNG